MAKMQTDRERQRMSERVMAGQIEIVSEARPNLMEESSWPHWLQEEVLEMMAEGRKGQQKVRSQS